MPAASSSPIPAAAHAAAPAALTSAQCRSPLDYLAQRADPRHHRGRRHPLAGVLGVAVAAVLAGARSLAAIGEWTADAPAPVLAALGVRRHPLSRSPDAQPTPPATFTRCPTLESARLRKQRDRGVLRRRALTLAAVIGEPRLSRVVEGAADGVSAGASLMAAAPA